ncbi:MAG: S8 family serine peptidase [Nocardioidaceae bacterium]|nr:S8 family serine peptidase [Nocardioidaceae bacterium]
MRLTRVSWAGAGLVVALVAGPLPQPSVATTVSAADVPCQTISADLPTQEAASASRPIQLLGVERAQALLDRTAPAGPRVRVAVVDSGVIDTPRIPVVRRVGFTRLAEVQHFHGTAVAGLIAGQPLADGAAVGVAPDAEIVDVRVFDDDAPTDTDSADVQPARVALGLRWVARHADRLDIGVVNVSLMVADDPRLAAAVRALRRADVVVVASTGNRPTEPGQPLYPDFATLAPGEDAAARVFPAGYPGVVGVNATSGAADADDLGSVLQSSATDVAAPTPGGVTVALNGGTCVLPDVATSWSAAEVSGVVAMLRARFPDENARQIAARLTATASAAPGSASPLVGAGVVQPVEALTRPLHPTRAGTVAESLPAPDLLPEASQPVVASDDGAALRHAALWWGLVAGGLVVLALLVRPLLARRRDLGRPAAR